MAAWNEGLKETCTKIVGSWFNEKTGQQLIFSLNDLLKMSPIVIIPKGKKPMQTEYGLGVKVSPDSTSMEDCFYFDVGLFNKQYYEIIELTRDKLILREFFMIPDMPPSKELLTYIRKTDITEVDNLLKELD